MLELTVAATTSDLKPSIVPKQPQHCPDFHQAKMDGRASMQLPVNAVAWSTNVESRTNFPLSELMRPFRHSLAPLPASKMTSFPEISWSAALPQMDCDLPDFNQAKHRHRGARFRPRDQCGWRASMSVHLAGRNQADSPWRRCDPGEFRAHAGHFATHPAGLGTRPMPAESGGAVVAGRCSPATGCHPRRVSLDRLYCCP
jgi:hypothetical protein